MRWYLVAHRWRLLNATCQMCGPSGLHRQRTRHRDREPVRQHELWERTRYKAGISDLRFHDLIHEAVSQFFEMGMSVPEVALISGHKDVRQLLRYTHLNPTNVFKKYEAF